MKVSFIGARSMRAFLAALSSTSFLLGLALPVGAFAQVPPAAFSAIVDDSDKHFGGKGSWIQSNQGFKNTSRHSSAKTSFAVWEFGHLGPGTYRVQATWPSAVTRTSNAQYVLRDGTTVDATPVVNQKVEPVGQVFGGSTFQTLADIRVDSGRIHVRLNNLSTGSLAADAIRIERVVPDNTGHGQLSVVVQSTVASDVAVSNQKNIPLMRFETRASQKDVLLTAATFTVHNGFNAQNYMLWVDTNADMKVDTIVQSGVPYMNGKVVMNKLFGGGFVVPVNGNGIIFELHADVAFSLSGDDLLYAKLDSASPTYIEAEGPNNGETLMGIKTDGVCATPNCDISVTTAPSIVYTLKKQGDLYVSKSVIPVRSRQLLGGTLESEILRLDFRAEHEPIDVTDLVFTFGGTDAASVTNDVDRLELYAVGAVTPFAAATVAGCGIDPVPAFSMCAKMKIQEFIVDKSLPSAILVRPRMRTDVDGAVSGHLLFLTISGDFFNNEGMVRARGLISSNNLMNNDGDAIAEGEVFIGTVSAGPNFHIVGEKNHVVLSKVTSIVNADPNADGTQMPIGPNSEIAQFKFSTAAAQNVKNGNNTWTLDGIVYNINATNVLLGTGDQTNPATSDFKLYNKIDPSVKHACTANKVVATGADLVVTCPNIVASGVLTDIDPDSDTTFVLNADVVNAKIDATLRSTLQVSLQQFTDLGQGVLSEGTSHIKWLDRDNSSNATAFFWIEYPEMVINGTSYQD